jgi:protein TonB
MPTKLTIPQIATAAPVIAEIKMIAHCFNRSTGMPAHLQRYKQYPPELRAAGIRGTLMLSFTVNRSGQVRSGQVRSGQVRSGQVRSGVVQQAGPLLR